MEEVKASSSSSSSVKSVGLSPEYASDPEDKDDDDRNHKHRRREAPEAAGTSDPPAPARAYRKENGPPESSCRHMEGKRRHGGFPPRRPINPNLFPGPPGGSGGGCWNGFGLIPGMGNPGLDPLHRHRYRHHGPMGFQAAFPRPRCRDFEEQGFCLRGDMCPLEHGLNRIVVDDVQSLSQFNLPVSLPSGQLLGAPVSAPPLPSVASHSATLMSRGPHSKSSKLGIHDIGLGMNGVYSSSAAAGGADVYDPDEPLWNDDHSVKSSALSALHSLKDDETEPSKSFGPPSRHHSRSDDDTDNEFQTRSAGPAVGFHNASLSVWGRIGGSKDRLDVKEKSGLQASTSVILEEGNKEDNIALTNMHSDHQGKRIAPADSGPKAVDSSVIQNGMMHNVRRPQKALRTLFVNGIPKKSNRREALLAHFQKFGQVIDIHIPVNSERAFVQFSKREEAEAALRAPDAVMGNRFIRLWWANRDSILDGNISSSGSASLTPLVGAATTAQLLTPIPSKAKENIQAPAPKSAIIPSADASLLHMDSPKLGNINGHKTPPSLQKKLELEKLKEELRKKQELLEQKRNDFRRQLVKFEKQASGSNGSEMVAEPSLKRQKTGMAADGVNSAASSLRDTDDSVATPRADILGDRNKSAVSAMNAAIMQQEPAGSKLPILPTTPARVPLLVNRYKLDNRPTTFRIMPPLPSDLANVDALREHFSSFGELSSVELEDDEPCDGDVSEKLKRWSAHVSFITRYSAEKAFLSGKCWRGNAMQLVWVKSHKDQSGSLPASTSPLSPDAQPAEKSLPSNSSQASASKDGDQEDSESAILKIIESDVISQFKPCLTSMSNQPESPEPEFCSTAMPLAGDPSSSAVSDEMQSS